MPSRRSRGRDPVIFDENMPRRVKRSREEINQARAAKRMQKHNDAAAALGMSYSEYRKKRRLDAGERRRGTLGQCRANTSKGHRCKRSPVAHSDFCWQHEIQHERDFAGVG